MGRTCCVVGCNVRGHNRQGKKIDNGLSFYSFPAWKQNQGSHTSEVTKRRQMAWISALRRADIIFGNIPRSLKVCSRHFHSGKPAYEMDEFHPDWAPTLHLGHSEVRGRQRRLKRVPEERDHNEPKKRKEDEVDAEAAGEEDHWDQAEAAGKEDRGDREEAAEEEEYRERTELEEPASQHYWPDFLKRQSDEAEAAVTSPTGEIEADPLESESEGSTGDLGHIIEVTVGESAEGNPTNEGDPTDLSSPRMAFSIERRYPQGSWEQATVEAIINLRSFDTTAKISQVIIANLKDENDLLRVQTVQLRSELETMQWKHEQELQDLRERLEMARQRCSCGAMSEGTDSDSEVTLDVKVEETITDTETI